MNIWQGVNNQQYRANDWKYRYMQAVWYGENQLLNVLDRVFKQNEDTNIKTIKQEVEQYEKDIRERGESVVNQERAKAEETKLQKNKKK